MNLVVCISGRRNKNLQHSPGSLDKWWSSSWTCCESHSPPSSNLVTNSGQGLSEKGELLVAWWWVLWAVG